MSEIKRGYGGKTTRIKISARRLDDTQQRTAELWIEQEGVQHWLLGATMKPTEKGKKYKDFEVVQDEQGNCFVKGKAIKQMDGQETLAYATLDELLALRDELNAVIQELVA